MKRVMIGLALASAALAGCSKPAVNQTSAPANVAAEAPSAAPVAATPPATGPAGTISLAELPAPTAGLWTRVSTGTGGSSTDTKCLDGKPINPTEGIPGTCPTMSATRTASGGFTVAGDCPSNGIDAKLSLAGEGDFTKHFTTDASMIMTGGPGGDMTLKTHTDYTYTGRSCAAPASAP